MQAPGQPVAGAVMYGQPTVGTAVPMGFPQTQGVLALVLSILGIVGCGICTAIPGLILANGALAITDQYPGHPDAGMAKTAQIIAWIAIGLTILGIVLYGLLFVFALAAGAGASASGM